MSHSVARLLHDSRSLGEVTQGVTTEIMDEGWTPAPAVSGEPHGLPGGDERWAVRSRGWIRFGDRLAAQEVGTSVNFGSFLGGATVRMTGRDHAQGESSPEELDRMRQVTREALEV